MKKLSYIDSLRGYAILGVVLVHSSQYGTSKFPIIVTNILNEGARGVQLFFIASAFTLFLSFNFRIKKEIFPVRNFFIRRFFRIAPMFYIAIVYYLFQNWYSGRNVFIHTPNPLIDILANFSFLNGFSPYWIRSIVPGGWSIAVEMSFYVLVPFLFNRIKSTSQAFDFFCFSLLANSLLKLFLSRFPLIPDMEIWQDFLFSYLPSQLPVFALGILLYFIVVTPTNNELFRPWSMLLFSFMTILQLSTKTSVFLPGHILFSILFFCVAFALSKKQPLILVNRIICYTGKISFSMYIIHFAVLFWLSSFDFLDFAENQYFNFIIRFLVVTAITVVISHIFYTLIEMPFQKLGKKIIDKLESNYTARKLV